MSDKDSKLLNLYLDGELSSDGVDNSKKEFLENHQEEYSQLLKLRTELRNHFEKELDSNFSEQRSEMLWNKIEAEVTKPVKKERPWYYIPMQGYAFAAMCSFLAFFVGTQLNGGLDNVLNNELNNESQANLAVNSSTDSSFKYVNQGKIRQIAVYNKQEKNVFHRLPIELDTEQLIGFNDEHQSEHQAVAMRTNGLDIDWIKSDKNYKLVKSSVPVIWVSD